jgi:cleavage and polyadenylation specificity factor subunit 4
MMRPPFNSQIQSTGNSAPPPQQQGNPCNPRPPNNFQGNPITNGNSAPPPQQQSNPCNPRPPNNFQGNPMPNSTQIQPQMPIMNNSQFQNPFNNYNGPNSTPFFVNNPNVPFINTQFPMPNSMQGQQGQFYNGFNCPQNMNPILMNNNCQPNPGLSAPPYFNQNVGYNPMCQFVPMPMPMPMPNFNHNPQVAQGMFQNHFIPQTMAPHPQMQIQMQMPNFNANGNMQEQQHQQQNNNANNRSTPPNSVTNGVNNAAQQQGNLTKENGVNIPSTNWKNSPNKTFNNERGEKAYNNRAHKSGFAPNNQTQVEKKRLLPLNYTEEEIRQWREERKKNFPSKDNADKKLTKGEIADRDAKLRRQRLKEILRKQAELGCEVAEIPRDYLSDSENFNKRGFNKDRRQNNFKNRRGRGRFGKNNSFTANSDQPSEESFPNKKQRVEKKENKTLLQKLLCSDVKRDKSHLLQVCRFLVINCYLKEYKSENKEMLKFPHVVVKQVDKLIQERVNVCDKENDIQVVKQEGISQVLEEEEGEIID